MADSIYARMAGKPAVLPKPQMTQEDLMKNIGTSQDVLAKIDEIRQQQAQAAAPAPEPQPEPQAAPEPAPQPEAAPAPEAKEPLLDPLKKEMADFMALPEAEQNAFLKKQSLEQIFKNKRDAAQQEEMVRLFKERELKRAPELDLSSVAMLADAWGGTNLAKAYKAPEKSEDRLMKIAALEQAIQKQGGNLADQFNDLVKASNANQAQSSRMAGTQSRFETAKAGDNREKARSRFGQEIKKDVERLSAVAASKSLLSGPGGIADNVVKRQMAKLAGEVGAMTDADIRDFGGNRGMLQRLEQYVQTADTGSLTPENKKELMDIILVFEKGLTFKLRTQAKRLAKSYAKDGYNSEKDLYETLDPDALIQSTIGAVGQPQAPAQAPAPAPAAAPQLSLPTNDAIAAEMERRKKARGQ